jgi:uracil phosphoribosyltransferase
MEIKILGNSNSILTQHLAEIRDVNIQNDPLRFRTNLNRIGEIFAYEVSKELDYAINDVQTPLGIAKVPKLTQQPVLATILRAGLATHNGLLRVFDRAENCFISAFRKYTEDGGFEIEFEYMASPSLQDKVVILSDPMLASGKSMEIGYEALFSKGTPKHVHLIAVIASKDGVEYLKDHIKNDNVTLWLGSVDPEMNSHSYIIPGLGDAGDLAFGEKIDSK